FAPTPKHKRPGATFGSEVHGPHSLLQGVSPDPGVIGGESSIAKDRIVKKIDRGHWHYDSVFFARLTKLKHDLVALLSGRIDRHQVVVMEVDAPGADLGQHPHGINRPQCGPYRIAKRIAAAIANGPEAKGKLIFRTWCVFVFCHLIL